MGELEPTRRRGLPDLKGATRADLAHTLWREWVKGSSKKDLMERHNVTRPALNALLDEYATIVQEHRPSARLAGEEQYRMLQEFAWKALDTVGELDPEDGGMTIRSQNVTKFLEVILQSQTRLDKYYGLEAAQVHVHSDAKTFSDLVKQHADDERNFGEVDPLAEAQVEDYIDELPEPDEEG
jgi:hemerythrin-like domain-containing protein